jgi:hypothetical protein
MAFIQVILVRPVVDGAMGCGQKIFTLMKRCYQLLSGFLAKRHVPRVSLQSLLSANDSDIEIIPRTVHRSPGIYLKVEENIGKPQLADRR